MASAMLLVCRGKAAVRPVCVRLASARAYTRLRGVSPDGRHRCGPHQRALRAVVLGESVRWTRGTQTFKLPIRKLLFHDVDSPGGRCPPELGMHGRGKNDGYY